jgi:hypothetical protein
MLTIRRAQWEAMRRAREEEFRGEIARMIRLARPEWRDGEGGDEALEAAAWIMRQAASNGIFLKADIVRFAQFVLRYGRDYATRPDMEWANRILKDLELIGPQKLDELQRRAE